MNEGQITKEELSDREMLNILYSKKTADEIIKLINSTYDYCKTELEKQEELMKEIGYDHVDFRVQTHMLGYHKGRLALLENLKFAIQ